MTGKTRVSWVGSYQERLSKLFARGCVKNAIVATAAIAAADHDDHDDDDDDDGGGDDDDDDGGHDDHDDDVKDGENHFELR